MKLLLYSTKANPSLMKYETIDGYYTDTDTVLDKRALLNGKIVAECDFDVEKIEYKHIHERDKFGILHNESWFEYRGINIGNEEDCDLPNKSCLSVEEIFDYLINKDGYAIHIKNLHIFDKPRDLRDYYTNRIYTKIEDVYTDEIQIKGSEWVRPIKQAPQNMMYAYDNKEKKILISIRPEWLCKILNKEKTIEVRKKVLKEMLNNA